MARAIKMREEFSDCWRAMHGRVSLALIVPPSFMADFKMRPSDDAVRAAVKECSPGYGVTDTTPIQWPYPAVGGN